MILYSESFTHIQSKNIGDDTCQNGEHFLTMQELEKKRVFIRPFIRYTDMECELPILFKEIQQELLGKINEKIEKHQFILNICAEQQVGA